jgi:hypothetical protein
MGGLFLRVLIGLVALVTAPAMGAQAQGLPGGDWQPAAGAAGDNTIEGFIDQPAAGANIAAGAPVGVSGWVVDTTAEGWSGVDDVQVLLGSTLLTHVGVGVSRPDVANALGNPFFGNAGFSGVVSNPLPGGAQTLTIVAHTPGRGSWSKQVIVDVGGSGAATTGVAASGLVLRIIAPSTDDLIPSNTSGVIYGVAYDTRTRAELGVGVDRIQLYLDGPRGQAGSQNLGDAAQSGTNWSLAWAPTRFNHVLHHVLFVYARSAVTGEEVLLQEEINLSH